MRALEEVGRAVQRIDDPDGGGVNARCPGLLSDEAVLGKAARHQRLDHRLRLAIGPRDEVVGTLLLDNQVAAPTVEFAKMCASLTCGLHRCGMPLL